MVKKILPNSTSIFSGLDVEQLKELTAAAEFVEMKKDQEVMHEGRLEDSFYYILEGTVKIIKNSGEKAHILTHLSEGETVGEMALIDKAPRSATAICLTPCKFYRFDINSFNNHPKLRQIRDKLLEKVSKKISQRLRSTNEIAIEALKSKFIFSLFTVRLLTMTCLYTLFLNLIQKAEKYLEGTTLLSVLLVIIFTMVSISFIRKSGKPLSFYGLNLMNAKKNVLEAILYSLPILIGIMLLKFIIISTMPSFNHVPLFEKKANLPIDIYFTYMILYSFFCPFQEFISRGCIQTSLQNLLEGRQNTVKWNAIILANLVFSSAHAHTSFEFVSFTFILGMFWGWMYDRQKSLLGVSISHILIGLWVVFIVGFRNIT